MATRIHLIIRRNNGSSIDQLTTFIVAVIPENQELGTAIAEYINEELADLLAMNPHDIPNLKRWFASWRCNWEFGHPTVPSEFANALIYPTPPTMEGMLRITENARLLTQQLVWS